MKNFAVLLLLAVAHVSFSQNQSLLEQKKHFDQHLKPWMNTFSSFNLSDFQVVDTLHFENNFPQDFKRYKKFLSVYQPIITYLPDHSKFIDIYSCQLNLEKKGSHYEANPDIDQVVLLCDPKTKYWNRIFFGTYSQWIDEVVWLSKTKFILVGIIKSEDNKKQPLILLGHTNKQVLVKFVSLSSFQTDKGYSSPKLNRIEIEGL